MTYGVVMLLAFNLLRGNAFIIEPTAKYVGSLVYLAIGASVLAFARYLTLLRRLGAARAGYATVLFPIVALARLDPARGLCVDAARGARRRRWRSSATSWCCATGAKA